MADRTDTPEAPRWQRRPTERRREILDAAALIFGERGFESATPALVAARAGGRAGTVQHYFGTKTALFQEVIADRLFSGVTEDEALLINHRGSYTALLRALLERTWTRLSRPGTAELLLVGMASAGNCPEAGRVVSGEMSGRCPRVLRGVIEAGGEAGEFRPGDAGGLARGRGGGGGGPARGGGGVGGAGRGWGGDGPDRGPAALCPVLRRGGCAGPKRHAPGAARAGGAGAGGGRAKGAREAPVL